MQNYRVDIKTIGWEKYDLFQTPFESIWMDVECRTIGIEMEKW